MKEQARTQLDQFSTLPKKYFYPESYSREGHVLCILPWIEILEEPSQVHSL